MGDYLEGPIGASVLVDDSAVELFGGDQWTRQTSMLGAHNQTISTCRLGRDREEAFAQVVFNGESALDSLVLIFGLSEAMTL